MINEALSETESRMQGAIRAYEEELAGIRTGRASPALVERIDVDYYGTPTPLQQLASISVPEPRMLMIKPFDPGSLQDIERGIQSSDLGLTPTNDGKIIRLTIPALTEERRIDLVKLVKTRAEEARVAVRNVRRDAQNDLREYEHEKLISEDDLHTGEEKLQQLTDHYIDQINDLGEKKEAEVMEV